MGCEDYETVSFDWQDRCIEVSYHANWLNSGYWHLELRSVDPLPITQTGYRSAFVPADTIPEATDIEGYVLAWLDYAAEGPAWRKLVEDSRQLSLF